MGSDGEDRSMKCVDNLDSSVDVSVIENVIRNKNIHIYTLKDDGGNTTELQLEISHNNHEIKAEIIEMKYNGKSAALPKNSFKIEYTTENGSITVLNQFLVIGDTKVHLIYRGTKDETKIITNGIQQREKGLILMVMKTDKGQLKYSMRNMGWTI
jgi:hypothetical protein